MLKNYFKIALRNILRFKLYSFINIIGLSVGIASFVLIFSYVYNELSYDTFHKNAKKIYRIYSISRAPGNASESYFAVTPDPLPKALQNDYPGMFKVTRLFFNEFWVTRGNKAFNERIFGGDPSFFDVFSFRLLKGVQSSVLSSPNSAVITQEFAEKLFGNDDPMGKTLKINNFNFMVTGVLENFPINSSIKFDILIPAKIREHFDPGFENKWNSWGTHTFVLFSDKMTSDELRGQFPKLIDKYIPANIRSGELKLGLEQLTDIHLDSDFEYDIVSPVSQTFLIMVMVVAISILLISCVNFMNISVSRYAERAKEIGMRKVLGAQKVQVIKQFLCESILMSLISLTVGIVIAELFLDKFRLLTGKQIDLYPFFRIPNIFMVIGFGIIVGLIAGSYPAFFLSAYRPAQVFAKKATARSKSGVRNILLVGQFAIAAVLITSVFLIGKQINFMKNHDMGFQPENILAVPMENQVENRQFESVSAYVNSVNANKSSNGILSVAVSENIPGYYFNNTFGVVPIGSGDQPSIQMVVSSMNENFVDTYGIKLVEGRNFSAEHSSAEEGAVIMNQTAARVLGWSNPIGKQIKFTHDDFPLTVIGVMKDINIASLQSAVEPMIYRYAVGEYENEFVSVKLDPSHVAEGLSSLKANWDKVFPNSPFNYFFVKDKYDASYEPEDKTGRIIEVFSALAIFLAGLGLFGLSSLKVTQRTKEIGVRKVLGATMPDILGLFTKEFLLLVLAANLIAVPVSYLAIHKWLQNFAYRTNIEIGIFIITAILTLLIAFVAMSLQAIRAATANPVESLRYE